MRIAIIGAALAAFLALSGCDIILCSIFTPHQDCAP
jgi:hypothetical protein